MGGANLPDIGQLLVDPLLLQLPSPGIPQIGNELDQSYYPSARDPYKILDTDMCGGSPRICAGFPEPPRPRKPAATAVAISALDFETPK
jgi:hypothetical protein